MARPTSTRLREIVRSTHTARARVTYLANDAAGPFQQSLTPTNGQRLTVVDGDVRMDSSAVVRSTIDVTVQERWGYIIPAGAELFAEYGVEVAGGQFEWVALGYFRVEDVVEDGPGTVRVTGSDRMAQAVDTEALYPWVAPANISQQDFVTSLLFGRSPGGWFHPNAGIFPSDTTDRAIVADFDLSTALLGSQVLLVEGTFQEHLQALAARYSKRLFFDYRGRLNIVSDAVAAAASPVREVAAGRTGGLRNLRRRVSRDGVYNSVVARGDQPTEGDPPWGFTAFYDFEPGGLDWFGEFGRVLKRTSSPLLKTAQACDASANTWLRKVRGLPYSVSFSMPADPTLEPLDTVDLTFPTQQPSTLYPPPTRAGSETTERHVIDTLTFPLTGGDMQVTTRGALMNGHTGEVFW